MQFLAIFSLKVLHIQIVDIIVRQHQSSSSVSCVAKISMGISICAAAMCCCDLIVTVVMVVIISSLCSVAGIQSASATTNITTSLSHITQEPLLLH